MKDFRLHIINGQGPLKGQEFIYESAFTHWHQVWTETFFELNQDPVTFSDNFTRQNEILCLFQNNLCVAAICHRFVNLANPALRYDSYFKDWPSKLTAEICKIDQEIVIGNQISVEKNFRTLSDGTITKDLLVRLSLQHLARTEKTKIISTVRKDKSLDQLFANYGADFLNPEIKTHNAPVALIQFDLNKVRNRDFFSNSPDWQKNLLIPFQPNTNYLIEYRRTA